MQNIYSLFSYSKGKDSNYWKYGVTTILQMLSKCSEDKNYVIFIISNEDLSEWKKQIKKFAPINIHYEIKQVKIEFKKYWDVISKNVNWTKNKKWTEATWYRVLLAHELPKEIEKICYFDFDVIFNCDIAEFYNLDIKKYHLIGCEDDANKSFSRQIRLKKIKSKRLSPIAEKLISHPQYICAGVLLFNIEKIRSDNLTEKFIQEMSNNYAFGDQDVLNILCEKKINNYYGITPLHTFFYCKYVFNFKICHCTFPKQWSKHPYFFLFFLQGFTFFKFYFEWRKIYKNFKKI